MYGSVHREAGWGSHKELVLRQEKPTVGDVLMSVKLKDGRALFDLVADEAGIKAAYSVMLNGLFLQGPKDLAREIRDHDSVTALDFFRMSIGG